MLTTTEKSVHEILGEPVLWKQIPKEEGRDGLHYFLYYRDEAARRDATIKLGNFRDAVFKMMRTPHEINDALYHTIKIDQELGIWLEHEFPESHQIHEMLERGGGRTADTVTGKASIEKLEAAFSSESALTVG